MFLIPLSLYDISQLRDPSERVPLGERIPYEHALKLLEEGGFESFELFLSEDPQMHLRLFWYDGFLKKSVTVQIKEDKPRGPLAFSCSLCLEYGRKATQCVHQWASYVLIWQALCLEKEKLSHPELLFLAEELRGRRFLGADDSALVPYEGVTLDSLSLFLEEPPLFQGTPLGKSLGSLLNHHFGKYQRHEVSKSEELLSPRLWSLPEVFRKKLTAYSERDFQEVNLQNRLAEMVQYNFSNGQQISAKEILRHPLQKKVPGELLPQRSSSAPILTPWPLLPEDTPAPTPALEELELVLHGLLENIVQAHRRKKIAVFLQTKAHPKKALQIHSLERDPSQEMDWRVELLERKELEAEFVLVSFRKQPLYFFSSFAVEQNEGVVIVHPWLREFHHLQEALLAISEERVLTIRERPRVDVWGELETKTLLKYLRARRIPVKVSGGSRTLGSSQSLTEVRVDEAGSFHLQHEARVPGQKNVVRRGWTSKAALYLQTLSQGLPFLLNTDPRELATHGRGKRDWDLKILKHLGILQYLALEVLSWRFEGHLSDDRSATAESLFSLVSERIQNLLLAGTPGSFLRDHSLSDLCSKSVLACFEEFVQMTLKSLAASETFLSESGEVVLEGVLEREFRLIYELLKKAASESRGEIFQKSRTPFLSKITKFPWTEDLSLTSALFHFPQVGASNSSSVSISVSAILEDLQVLIPQGFKVYYKDQVLQELQENEFQVDFVLQTEGESKDFNWFELNPRFFLQGAEVDPERFLSLGQGGVIEYEGKLFLVPQKQMPSLRSLEFFWQKLQKGKGETNKNKKDETLYRLPRHHSLELLAMRASGVSIRGDEEWQRLCHFYDHFGGKTREFVPPSTLKVALKPYQRAGVQWLQDLYQLRLGALLADDMGLGKTLQTLAFLEDLRLKNEMEAVLIVVPSSLVFNWESEIEKFTPSLSRAVFSARDRDMIGRKLEHKEPLAVIVTYGLLKEHEDFMNQYRWNVVVFDEAQNLKNITTKRSSAARSLNARFKIGLTGTPMENHYGEFYSLVDILVPGSLGRIEDFRRQFVNSDLILREEMEELRLKIKPLLLRRTKKEILDQLPAKQESVVSIAFEERQKEIYRDIALSYNRRVQESMAAQGEASVQLQMLTALLRLRQACSDPGALPQVRYDLVPPKLETLVDSLREVVESGESALVFTQFLQTLSRTADLLHQAKIPVFVLHGGLSAKQRQKVLAAFQDFPGGAVLVMTLKTGGVGLNLTRASYVFHLEPWWNPSVENQATDRAHRLGQSKAVQVFRYIMHESLEEKIELLKEQKLRKFQFLFTDIEKEAEMEAGSAALSKEDFDFLLGLQ